ncbi:MAG: hypothetical protein ACHQ4H_04980 [Ktedonobacterales bacterium]
MPHRRLRRRSHLYVIHYHRTFAAHIRLLDPLHRWGTQDGYLFTLVAAQGYHVWWHAMMWPAIPGLEHLLAPIFGGDYVIAGMVASNAAFFGTLVALRALTARELGAEAARRAALYLAIFPTAFYFFAPYSESLFLLLSIGTFAALRSRRWLLAGVIGCLAMLTRSAGALLVIPFAVEFFFAWRAGAARWWQGVWVALIPAAAGIFSGYLALEHDDPLAYVHSGAYWGHTLHWPWESLLVSAQELLHHSHANSITLTHLALNLVTVLAFIALVVVVLRRLPLSYGLYSAAIVLYFLSLGQSQALFMVTGNGRYVLMVFPAFMLLGAWGRKRWLDQALLITMPALLALLTAHFLLLLASG